MEPRNTSPLPTPVACTTYSKPISLWSGRFRLQAVGLFSRVEQAICKSDSQQSHPVG